jgi:hypothetical protein
MAVKLLLITAAVAAAVTGQSPPEADFRNFDPDDGAFCTDEGLKFDGTDDFLATNPAVDISGDHTITMRLKYSRMDQNFQRLFDFSGSVCGDNSYFVDAYTSSKASYQPYGCGSMNANNFWLYGDDQGFHTYTFTSSAGGEFKAYRDGSLVETSGSGTCSAANFNAQRNTHYIGGSTCVGRDVYTFHGVMAFFSIHNSVLSADDIQNVAELSVRSTASHFFDFVEN